eukprot:1147099-Pelagomonas_calceolata.AAC.1
MQIPRNREGRAMNTDFKGGATVALGDPVAMFSNIWCAQRALPRYQHSTHPAAFSSNRQQTPS